MMHAGDQAPDLQPVHIVLEYIDRFSRTMLVAAPVKPLVKPV
jgi:hypothetical protein